MGIDGALDETLIDITIDRKRAYPALRTTAWGLPRADGTPTSVDNAIRVEDDREDHSIIASQESPQSDSAYFQEV